MRRGTCSTGCPEGAKASTDRTHWPGALRDGARLITRARAREIVLDEQGRASGVVYIDRDGVERRQRAAVVILAANGVGTPRLLLLSQSKRFPDGLANSSGLVGRRLMLHPYVSVLGVYEDELRSWRGPAGTPLLSLEFADSDESRGFPVVLSGTPSPKGGRQGSSAISTTGPSTNVGAQGTTRFASAPSGTPFTGGLGSRTCRTRRIE